MLIAKASGEEIAEELMELRKAEASASGKIHEKMLKRDLAAAIRVSQ